MKKWALYFFLLWNLNFFLHAAEPLHPYFKYEESSLRQVCRLHAENRLTAEPLYKWDHIAREEVNEKKISQEDILRFWAYLYHAQLDFAALSLRCKGEYVGSIDLLSHQVISLFDPSFHSPVATQTFDPFTVVLTGIVMSKIKERFAAETKGMREASLKEGELYWKGESPYFGLRIPSYKTWRLPTVYRSPPLSLQDTAYWNNQVEQLRHWMSGLDQKKKEAIDYWAGKKGMGGDWFVIVSDYTSSHPIALEKLILLRANLSAALLDAFVCCFESKYTYLVKRPTMLDPTLKSMIRVPNHPSYPSAHSTSGGAAEVVLSFYLPENEQQWHTLAEEAGFSRLWAGIHYPVDHEEGRNLGKKVALEVLKQSMNPKVK